MYGSGSYLNPLRVCEVVGLRCSVLHLPEHYIMELSSNNTQLAVYMKTYFRKMLLLYNKLNMKVLHVKACVDEELLRCRKNFPAMTNTSPLLQYLFISDVHICTVTYIQKLLGYFYLDLISLSMHLSADSSDSGVICGSGAASVLDEAECIMTRIEQFSKFYDSIEQVILFNLYPLLL